METATDTPAAQRRETGPPPEPQEGGEDCVLVLAPTGNDARLTAQVLSDASIKASIRRDVTDLCRGLEGPCAAIIVAEEILGARSVVSLLAALARQPAWSDIPVIMITSGGEVDQARLRRLAAFGPGSNVTLLERPFRPGTLISSVQTALRSRFRQYQVRDLLREVSSARDAAEEANHAKDNFLAALSHELRTPLNPVLLLATEAAENENVPAEMREDFSTIAKNVMLEARLIDDLLDLTRITRGKLTLDRRPVALNGVLRDAVKNVRQEILEKDLALSVDLYGDPRIDCDPVRMQQVFWNVLKNAVKFTDPKGQIWLRTRPRPDCPSERMIIEISDNGVGISAGDMERIFDAFAQGEHAGKMNQHRFGGLGLGLAISRKIVEMHSGTIAASSAGAGAGAKFTIELPTAPAAAN